MNPEFKVLTNVNESNLRAPIIQNRFRKLTLQSPKQLNPQAELPEPSECPQPELPIKEIVHQPVSQNKSQAETITNKLMLSTSSGNATEETNFINVETEPFTNPLRIESTGNEIESPNNSPLDADNNDLASQMEKLEVSRVSVDLFSQFSSSSKFSMPHNRIVSNKENIETISQGISNIRMSAHDDLADTQPNTSSQSLAKSQMKQYLADTQPNSSPILLSSDGEDDNNDGEDDKNDDSNQSLLTEETEEDDSVIEILSSDTSLELPDDSIPRNISPINTQVEGISESVAQKLNHFFDNIPKLSVSHKNDVDLDSSTKNASVCSEINVSETCASNNEKPDENNVVEIQASKLNESNILELRASQSDENIDKSGQLSSDISAPQCSSNTKDDNRNNEADEISLHRLCLDESGKTSTDDNESDNQISSCHRNQSTDEKAVSIHEAQKNIDFEKLKTSGKNVISMNSPIINISAKVNINIRLSGFSSSTNSSDTDGTSENADAHSSEQSSKNNDSMLSETSINSSREILRHCRKFDTHTPASNSKNTFINTPNHKKIECNDGAEQSDEILPEQSDEISHEQSDEISHRQSEMSLESSVIDSSLIHSQRGDMEEIPKDEINNSDDICDSTTSVDKVKELIVTEADTSSTKEADNSLIVSPVKKPVEIDEIGEQLLVGVEADTSTTNQEDNGVSVSTIETSVEIDEVGEQLLNDIYGDTWRTPQLIKKCLSTRKKCLTDVPKRNLSRGFSLFRADIPSELDSTRITPSVPEQGDNNFNRIEQSQLVSSNEQINEGSADQSSRIPRSSRKIKGNRILDYSSDDDESDGNESVADSSFEPVESSGEESDSSVEAVEPKSLPRKKNKFVFLDLTCHEVIEDEDHENPDATAVELEKVCENFLLSLRTESCVQTPAPTKKNAVPITTKRKLFTPNYDDQIPFEEISTPDVSPNNNNEKIIQLKTPIPSYLIPPKFREKVEFVTPTIVHPPKKNQTPRTPATARVCGFLESLDDKLIPVQHCDPDALKFRTKFQPNKNELVNRLMKLFNERCFDNKLKDVPVSWNKKLTKTGGYCRMRKIGGVRKASVELSEKVITSADRVRDTLIHELCHAASWLIDADSGGHGKIWKNWTQRANKRFTELPKIERCHNYDIMCKYTYKCTICGLKSKTHSKSKKVENIRCAKCHGPIEVFLNKVDKDGKVTLVPPKEPSMFAKFVKENYKSSKETGCSHADVMKILSNNFAKLSVQEKTKYK